jgi:citrate synthase
MDTLKQKFFEKATALRGEIKTILSNHGEEKVDEVTLSQVYGGARGIISMIWEPSLLDPIEGIRFRGFSITELREKLPKGENGTEPMPEGLFWLLLTGEIPDISSVEWLCEEWCCSPLPPTAGSSYTALRRNRSHKMVRLSFPHERRREVSVGHHEMDKTPSV